MGTPAGSKPTFRFGAFELDAHTRELRSNGRILKLQEQPFQVLTALLERPGQLITREELKARLWTSDTFVDFEGGLNKVINRLREALADSADNPIFIETVPKRGYRFIPSVGAARDGHATPKGERKSNKWKILALPGIGLAVMAGTLWLAHRFEATHLSPPKIGGSRQITSDRVPKVCTLVTDGTRIYFCEFSSGHYILKEVATAGGETTVVATSVPDPILEGFDPEQSQLLVQADRDLWNSVGGPFWLVPAPGGPIRRLGEIVGNSGGWVPTHNGAFYFAKGKDIYLANHDGGNPRRITTAPGQVEAMQSSPDGSRLRFTAFASGKYSYSIWEVHLDGSELHPLLPGWTNPSRECCGTWTPDGRYYFFLSDIGDRFDIWMTSERTDLLHGASLQPVQLTSGPVSFSELVVSQGGKQLFAVAEQRRIELIAYDKKSKNFLPFLGGISATDVSYSADGNWVAYVTYPDGLLWRCRLDGSERLLLTSAPMKVALPHWSPDGQQIAFSAVKPGMYWNIWVISRDGGSPHQLTSATAAYSSWSPDGTTLAYEADVSGQPEQTTIRLLDLRTHQSSLLAGSEDLCFPEWSRNGRYLAARSVDGKKIVLFDFKTKKWRVLVANLGTINYFSWSRDSSQLYFDNSLNNESAYIRVGLEDSKLDRIVSLKGIQRRLDYGIPWSGLSPDEIPLFARDVSMQELYAFKLQLP